MFLKDFKDLENFKDDFVYTWKKENRFAFIVFENEEWFISYMDNYLYLMTIIINSKGHLLKGDGLMFEKMTNEGLTDKEAVLSFMEVLEHHFSNVDFIQEDKSTLFS